MAIFCAAGYAWLFYNLSGSLISGFEPTGGVCLIKHVTSLPCPSCGSTKSVLSLLHGQFREALNYNPLGIVLFLGLAIAPFWFALDLVSGNTSMLKAYRNAEVLLRKKWVAVPAILIVVANWIWNISKGM